MPNTEQHQFTPNTPRISGPHSRFFWDGAGVVGAFDGVVEGALLGGSDGVSVGEADG